MFEIRARPDDMHCAAPTLSPRQFQVRELFVALRREEKTPLTRQLEAQLREAIRMGRLGPGQQLPSTRILAEELGVSRGVVARAYTQLGAEGYVTLRQGANPRVRAFRRPQPEAAASHPDAKKEPQFRYDLRPQRPDVTQFPRQQWLRSLRHALHTATDTDVGYIDARGLPPLREEIAGYLARARGLAVSADRVVITAGSTHSLTLIQSVLRRRGERTIAFENPSQRLFHELAQRIGHELIGIPVDEGGLVVDDLRSSVARVVVVSPARQFPSGATYSPERRADLLRWGEERDGLILENDYDAEFRYDRAPIGSLQGLAPERVAYVGSTSKRVAPGLRLGWAVLPKHLVDDVTAEIWYTMLHLPALEQLALADFLRRAEFDRHLRRMRGIYRDRRDVLVRSLRQELPQHDVGGIAAGLHVVLELPSVALEAQACRRASQRGLAIQSMTDHALPGYCGPRGLLIGYGAVHENALPRAAHEVAVAVREASVSIDEEELTQVA